MDVDQGDAIQAPSGEVALVDGGEANTGIVSYLESQGAQHINLMVATHPHSDHIGGLVDVLRAMPVDVVVTNGQPHTTSIYEQFLDAIIAAQAEYTEVTRGDTHQLGSLSMQVLHPVSNTGDDLNDNSVVLRLAYGDTSFLLTGDVQTSGEGSMLAAGLPGSTTVLKVAHHASHSSSSPAFLSAVQPQVAVYSCGLGNSYGHPHPETLAALTAVGADIYGTDVNGSIVVTTDGSGYSISMGKSAEPRPQPTAVVPTAAPPTALPPAPGQATVAISSIYADGQVPRVESDEYAEITNTGSSPASLRGWRLNAGDVGQDFVFPDYSLGPGQSCRVYTNEVHPETGGLSFGSSRSLWNNKGDCGYLFDASGAQVSKRCY